MIGRFELLFSILVAWIIAGITYAILRRRNGRDLPSGSFVSEIIRTTTEEKAPGTWWSRLGVNLSHMICDLTLMLIVVLCIFDLWSIVSKFIALDLPIWLNYIGILGLWFQYIWQVAIMAYNVNFTPNSKSMQPRYILATGGPYKLVRHPAYANYIAVTLFLFLATGIWAILLGSIGWILLPRQAKAEEEAMERRFGKIYADYAAKTGRLFPRIRRRKIDDPL